MTNVYIIAGRRDDIIKNDDIFVHLHTSTLDKKFLLLLVISMHFDRDSVKLPYIVTFNDSLHMHPPPPTYGPALTPDQIYLSTDH